MSIRENPFFMTVLFGISRGASITELLLSLEKEKKDLEQYPYALNAEVMILSARESSGIAKLVVGGSLRREGTEVRNHEDSDS